MTPRERRAPGSIRAAVLVATALTGGWPQSTVGQDSTCTFRTCALQVERGSFGTALLRGPSGERAATIGLFPRHLDDFSRGPDSSLYYYHRFRHSYNLGSALAVAALVGAAAGGLLAHTADHGEVPILVGTSLFTLAVSWASHRSFSVGRRRLSQAVLWHNRGLLGAGRP